MVSGISEVILEYVNREEKSRIKFEEIGKKRERRRETEKISIYARRHVVSEGELFIESETLEE